MGLLEQEIKELRQMITMSKEKTITQGEVCSMVAIYNQIEKRAKLMVQIRALGCKYGNKHLKKISDTQIIGDGSVIDLDTKIEEERIFCSTQDCVITRFECKEYSETTGNLTDCQTCRNFKTTRRLLSVA